MAHCFFFKENAVMETSFSRDNWQGGSNSPNEENVSLKEIPYNLGQGPLGKLTRFYTLTFWPALHESFNA